VTLGNSRQGVTIALASLFDWIDRTFLPEDEHAFVASMRDLELLARIGWDSPFPQRLDVESVLNVEDLPEELAGALERPAAALVQCAACRRLCVTDDFVWKERQLCAWDYHKHVFGKRGPWREGAYEARHFETLPLCAYVAPELLEEMGVQVLLMVGEAAETAMEAVLNALLEGNPTAPHMAVRTASGIVVLSEKPGRGVAPA
jgi:hypothetical protein